MVGAGAHYADECAQRAAAARHSRLQASQRAMLAALQVSWVMEFSPFSRLIMLCQRIAAFFRGLTLGVHTWVMSSWCFSGCCRCCGVLKRIGWASQSCVCVSGLRLSFKKFNVCVCWWVIWTIAEFWIHWWRTIGYPCGGTNYCRQLGRCVW